jgi:hypothetical protein
MAETDPAWTYWIADDEPDDIILASTSATRATRAAISVTPVAVIVSRFAYRPRGRRSMTATYQTPTSPR